MFQAIDFKSELIKKETEFDAETIKVNVKECSPSHDTLSEHNIFSEDSLAISTEDLDHNQDTNIDYNKLVERETVLDVQKNKVKKEVFEDENFASQRNDKLFHTSMIDKLDVSDNENDILNIKISSVKSENIFYNTDDKKLYHCRYCKYKTANLKSVLEHVQIHSDNDQDCAVDEKSQCMCNECGYGCKQRSQLKSQIHSRKGLAFQMCDYKTKGISSLGKRMTRSTKISMRRMNVSHERIHTEKKTNACDQCDYSSSNSANLMRHSMQHTGEKPYACDYCEYRCAQKASLNRHSRRHTGEKPYACNHCDYKSIEKAAMVVHSKNHTGEKPYACDHCDYRSVTKAHLIRHSRRHTGEKEYACNHCNYRSSDKAAVISHSWHHTVEKPFACDHCEYRSSYKTDLSRHMRLHTGAKPYECDNCDYKSSYKKGLDRHKSQYTGGKPFVCDCCDYKSCYKNDLVRHKRQHL